jgi:hypothetical protein
MGFFGRLAATAGAATAGALAIAAGLPAQVPAATAKPPTAQEAEFFETNVRPVLFEKCFGCHGSKAQQGGLRLDARASALQGGGNGPAIVAGNPDNSLLIKAVRYTSALKMPPSGKLKPAEIAALTDWVRMGAPWPDAKGASAAPPAAGVAAPAQWWSFRPVKKTSPPKVKNAAWIKTPIDNFILAKLESKSLAPAPPADRRTLIRRATFDLTGLPPTVEEIKLFVNDRSPRAFEKVVDRLLASPAYGERWGRHWLDVARYADTKGYVFTEDAVYHNAYTYRDWVIRSVNEDLSYDQFLIQQLAADKLQLGDDQRPLAALGFLTVGRRFLNDAVFINDDRIDVTCRGLMGLTVACARCHNHKFDPISSKDYYALYGVFASSSEPNPPPPISPKQISEPYERQLTLVRDAQAKIEGIVREQVRKLRARVQKTPADVPQDIKSVLQSIRPEVLPEGGQLAKLSTQFDPDARKSLPVLGAALDDLKKHMPPAPEFAMALKENEHPFDPYVFIRGNPGNHGDSVPRRFITCISREEPQPFKNGSGRLELAQDIASKDNPLTARVFVNRVWMYHFGAGIVRTPGDFGKRGDLPTHPELLDWLAATFVENGWSPKKLHKLIMLSSAYQQSSLGTMRAKAVDPENRLLSHQNRQRLDLEALRDSALFVAGQLDRKMGGPAVEITTPPYATRRTVYGFIDRQNLQGLFRTFDFASPDASSAQRYNTTVPQQALFMMNSPFLVEEAKALSKRPEIPATADNAARISAAYDLLFGRAPSKEEIAYGVQFLRGAEQIRPASNSPAALTPWEAYCQALLMTNEFSFVD